MNNTQFPFSQHPPEPGQLPSIPLTLTYHDQSTTVSGLLDTGATVNVLPYDIGRALGAVWDEQETHVQLTGNLAHFEARGLMVTATINDFEPVTLIFAWTQSNHVPVILGQINFFLEFDVCFFASQAIIEITPSQKR